MISETISLWGKGSVTLPKKWRDQFPTTHYMAVEVPEGLLIKPIIDIAYEEYPDGGARLRFPMGIESEEFLRLWREAGKKIDKKRQRTMVSKKK